MGTNWCQWFFRYSWTVEVLTVLLLLVGVHFLIKRSLLVKGGSLKGFDWRKQIDRTALTPLRILLWGILFSFLADLAARECALTGLFLYVGTLRNVFVVFCLAWFLLRVKRVFQNALLSHRGENHVHLDTPSLEVMGKIFTISVIFISLLVILQLFGVDVIPLMTFGGIGAAAVGIAGKDVIANFFGGLMVYMTRPFVSGDLVELPQKNVTGYIEEIGWYFTAIRTLEKKPVYIPNSIFSTEILVNQSRRTHRRIEEVIQIRYSDRDKLPFLLDSIRTLFQKEVEIDQAQPLYVFFKTFDSYSIVFEIQAYTQATRYPAFMKVREKMLLAVYDLVKSSGADMPYPILTVQSASV